MVIPMTMRPIREVLPDLGCLAIVRNGASVAEEKGVLVSNPMSDLMETQCFKGNKKCAKRDMT